MLSTNAKLDKDKANHFMERALDDVGTALHAALCYIGDRLGLFAAMANKGPQTAEGLAAATGLSERYLREWLGSMAAARYVEYDPQAKTFFLPPEHAAVLCDAESPYFIAGFLQELVPAISMAPQVKEAFLTGKGVSQSLYPPETFEAIERATAPWYKHSLVQKWIPAMPPVQSKLEKGASVLDVGCGSGQAAITIALAYPNSSVCGYDSHEGSIARARANAQQQGASVDFRVHDCTRLPPHQFDFITTFDVIHDAVDPLGILRSIRQCLTDGGIYLMLEMNAGATVEENISPMGKLLYGISTLYCMTVSLAEGGAGIGALMGEPKARELASEAGFSHFRKLPVDDPFSNLYELKA